MVSFFCEIIAAFAHGIYLPIGASNSIRFLLLLKALELAFVVMCSDCKVYS